MVTSNSYLQFGIINRVNGASGMVGISQKYIHPNYDPSIVQIYNDIAILKVGFYFSKKYLERKDQKMTKNTNLIFLKQFHHCSTFGCLINFTNL